MQPIVHYRNIISSYFNSHHIIKEPKSLYEPIDYILSLGGKRMRPVLTLMAAEAFGADCKEALPAAVAVEMFHNFSLVHDDIMDDAPLRRGNATVHEKWDLNTAILSGDAMLILAYRYFEEYEPVVFRSLAKLFSKTALEVCEGQQWDVDFESRDDVTLPEYLKMIEYKTAVLVAAALQMGAIVAGTTEENCRLIYEFGRNLGIAFQLQDDLLDAFGDPETFGKQVGGDIIENKKTYLYLLALQNADAIQKKQLQSYFASQPEDSTDKVEAVKGLFIATAADEATKTAIADYTQRALMTLDAMEISGQNKAVLQVFANKLMERQV
ncbi:MAG: polyprenyl synthetase family protein [Flavobacterium sp.]